VRGWSRRPGTLQVAVSRDTELVGLIGWVLLPVRNRGQACCALRRHLRRTVATTSALLLGQHAARTPLPLQLSQALPAKGPGHAAPAVLLIADAVGAGQGTLEVRPSSAAKLIRRGRGTGSWWVTTTKQLVQFHEGVRWTPASPSAACGWSSLGHFSAHAPEGHIFPPNRETRFPHYYDQRPSSRFDTLQKTREP